MQLNITTDYAIRVLLYLAITGKRTGSAEIAAKMGIPQQYLITMALKLKKAGMINAVGGPNGGYCLEKDPADITLYDVLQLMEGTTKLNRCLEADAYCSRFATASCPVRKTYLSLQHHIEDHLQRVTIASLRQNLE